MKKSKDIFRHTKLKLFIIHGPPLKGLLLCQLGFSPTLSLAVLHLRALLPHPPPSFCHVWCPDSVHTINPFPLVSLCSSSVYPPPTFDLGLLIPMVQAPSNCHLLHLTPTKQPATHRLMDFLLSSSLEYAMQAT